MPDSSNTPKDGWDLEVDLVSVGAGAGGLAASITAASEGLRALVLEKDSKLGGVTAYSQGEVWVGGNHHEEELGIEDSARETAEYLHFLGAGGLADEELQRSFLENSLAAVRFLEEKADLAFQVIRDRPDYFFPHGPGSKREGRYLEVTPFDTRRLGEYEGLAQVSPHGFGWFSQADQFGAGGDPDKLAAAIHGHVERHELCGGSGLSARLLKGAIDHGVDLRVESPAVKLFTEDGRVVGVEAETPDGPLRIGTRATVIAVGGYDWNPELMKFYEHVAESWSMAPTTVTGDHVAIAGEIGAAIAARPPALTPLLPGMQVPGEEVDGVPLYRYALAGQPHSIYVNSSGKRVGDESFYPDVDPRLSEIDGNHLTFPNHPIWMVFDQNFREKYRVGHIAPSEELPEGLVETGETLRELAEKAGFDAANFEATVERFNGFCADGVDADFGRGTQGWGLATFGDPSMPNPVLGPLDKKPYYAIKLLRVGTGIPSAGLRIDGQSRVISTRGKPIPGLYAAGNSAAQLDFVAYQSGCANTRGLTYGYLAAQQLLAEIGSLQAAA